MTQIADDSVFETERLIARFWRNSDAQRVYEIYREPSVIRYLGRNAKPMDSLELAIEWTEKRCEMQKTWPTGKGFWALETKETHELIGAIICKSIPDGEGNPSGDIEIGWHLGIQFWGKGYATEAAREVLKFGFLSDPNLDYLVSVCNPENVPSENVMKRIGMMKQPDTDKYYGETLRCYRINRIA